VSCAKTTKPIVTPFYWDANSGGPREACIRSFRCAVHRRHLANTTEQSVCGEDAALYQITLSTCCSLFKLISDHKQDAISCNTVTTVDYENLQKLVQHVFQILCFISSRRRWEQS